MNDLSDFLSEAQVQKYYQKFVSNLKVTNLSQLRDVSDEDLVSIGMSNIEIDRMKLHLMRKKLPATGAFGQLKKFFVKSQESKHERRHSFSEKDLETSCPSDGHLIQKSSVALSHQLGTGRFGSDVRLGTWTKDDRMQVQVAVKCLPKEKLGKPVNDFLKDISVLFTIVHPHLVPVLGVIVDADNVLLVMELAPLQSLTECLKDASLRSSLSVRHLCDLAKQIVDGLMYLEQLKLVHGNLAARNILVISIYQVKITDFCVSNAVGVNRKLLEGKESKELELILPWCAPECIATFDFTSASDVWSFGVTLWEMFSYGSQPWSDLSPFEIAEAVNPPSNCRLPKPKSCPDDWFVEMLHCWQHEPKDRPRFSELFSSLSQLKLSRVVVQEEGLPSTAGCIQCKKNDTITVLSKNPEHCPHPGFWLGVVDATNDVGFFNPNITTPHLELIISDVNLHRPPKINRSWSLRASLRPTSRKLTPSMISMPQNDMRHVGHVGFDGVVIGDVPFMSGSRSSSQSTSTLDLDTDSSASPLPVNGNRVTLHNPIGCGTSSVSILTSSGKNNAINNEGRPCNISDLKLPDLSDDLNFGGSLYDEIMAALDQALTIRGAATDTEAVTKKSDVTASSSNSTIVAESPSDGSEDPDNPEERLASYPGPPKDARGGHRQLASSRGPADASPAYAGRPCLPISNSNY